MHKGQVLSIRHYVQPTECSKHQGDDGTTVESTTQTANTFSAKIVPIVSVRPDGHLHMICAYHPPEIVCTWTLGNTATKPMNSLHLCARVQGCATPASLKLSIWGRPCIACIARMRQGETGGGVCYIWQHSCLYGPYYTSNPCMSCLSSLCGAGALGHMSCLLW